MNIEIPCQLFEYRNIERKQKFIRNNFKSCHLKLSRCNINFIYILNIYMSYTYLELVSNYIGLTRYYKYYNYLSNYCNSNKINREYIYNLVNNQIGYAIYITKYNGIEYTVDMYKNMHDDNIQIFIYDKHNNNYNNNCVHLSHNNNEELKIVVIEHPKNCLTSMKDRLRLIKDKLTYGEIMMKYGMNVIERFKN